MTRGPYKLPPVEQKLMARVQRTETGCWEWTGSRTAGGYGQIRRRYVVYGAHRLSYETFVGPIPEGLHLDHLCRNPPCINPEHLEPVTSRENCLRGISPAAKNAVKTHCVNGHPLTGANLAIDRGHRACVECRRRRGRKRMRAARATGPAGQEHGLRETYNKWGCRCDPCRAASAAYLRERKAARKAVA